MYKKDGKIWDKFVIWCEKHGVDFTPQYDYELLWKCWFDAQSEPAEEPAEEPVIADRPEVING